MKAAAMASIAGMVWGVGGFWAARCLREKRARKRLARGTVSEQRSLRRARTIASGWEVMAECMFAYVG